MTHTELLNKLIEKHNLKSYLEIGVRTTEANFDKIRCDDKRGVDPEIYGTACVIKMTSDNYFIKEPTRKFDIIFIDGLHHADQVKRDFENSLRCLNDNGFIVIHDTLPTEEITTCVPRGNQKIWFGDVYKFAMTLHSYDGIGFVTYDMDCGCTVVWKDATRRGVKSEYQNNWQTYKEVGRVLLNVVDENFPLPSLWIEEADKFS